jgi:N-acetylmuramoyl-L-alanine amidase
VRDINKIVIHCTGTEMSAGQSPEAHIAAIERYWRSELRWKSPGYHYIICPMGGVHPLQDPAKPSNGVAGHNANAIHIAYIGGKNGKDTRNEIQKEILVSMVKLMRSRYPNAVVVGHSDLAPKACPCFDAKKEYAGL